MTIAARPAFACLLATALLPVAGCASRDGFPSLAPRPIERMARADAPAEAETPSTADPALVQRIAAVERSAGAAAAAFADVADQAQTALARPGATVSGSDAWAAAQTRYSAAVAARGALQDAVDELDALRRERENGAAADIAAIEAAGKRIAPLDRAADARLSALAGRLAP
ncbi:MAG: hypothetical protein PGN09_11210 [Sphingomonas fennica]